MPAQNTTTDVFDLDVRTIVDPTEEATTSIGSSSGIPTLCSNECTGDCCTIFNCN
ncbi:hypothetical protein ABT288_10970 [Streptomyces sp. NPDC001093]|uniref:hypothetical protein n=1 Tax=Streptomyces sp. NPDC001093 TaxID=3154376 RepID=UPI003327E903